MGLLSKLFRRNETRTAPADFLPTAFGMFGATGYNDSGVSITEGNALICGTVWACTSIIAQTIGTMPVAVTRRQTGEKLYDHPLARLLTVAPNAFMTPAVFKECWLANALLWGGGYAVITKTTGGEPDGLYPVRSDTVRPYRQAGLLLFEVRNGSSVHQVDQEHMLYLPGLTLDGFSPVSPVKSGQQAIAVAVAMERYAAKAFGGANVGGILSMPKMSEEAMESFVSSWRRKYVGIDNAFRVAVLPDPFKFTPTSMDPEKGQMTQARQAQVLEIARFWRVPPHLLGLMDVGSSYSSIEQQNMSFYQNTIAPWCIKAEQEMQLKCLLERERPELEIRFNLDSLLRASTQERYTAYQTGRQGGWLSINDIRRKENLPPIDNGDTYLEPLNMAPVGKPGTLPTPPAPDPKPDGATRSMLIDAIRRCVVKESKAIRRLYGKHSKPEEFRAGCVSFYLTHRDHVARVLAAPLKAAGVSADPAGVAARYVAESARLLTAGATADDLEDWPDTRAAELADELLNGGSENAAA